MKPEQGMASRLVGATALVAGLLTVGAFHDIGRQFAGFRLEYIGVAFVPVSELVFFCWYFALGILAVLFFSLFYTSFFSGERFEATLQRVFSWKFFLPCAAVILGVEMLSFQRWVLQYAAITDDEATYAFIAQTLLKGRLVNPSPGDIDFFRNQFVIIDSTSWYGKYPVGHPAFLALGEALGLRFLVVPILNVAVLVLTFLAGRRIFPAKEGHWAVLLLLFSPHFVFMGASQLSHTTEALCMMGGLLALLALHEHDRMEWSLAAGVLFGIGILVRPLPGLLFLPVVAAWVLFGLSHLPLRRRLAHLIAGGVPVLAAGGVLLLVNLAQTGEVLKSGYDVVNVDRSGRQRRYFNPFVTAEGRLSFSLFGGILRENFWLFGWPISLVFVPFARTASKLVLVWGLAAAVLSYRVLFPKTVVATLGPVYLTEMVPLLALAAAGGIVRARSLAERLSPEWGRRLVPGFLFASGLTAVLCFLPVVLGNIHRSSEGRQRVFRRIEEKTSGKVLVFANRLVDMREKDTWAYYPPNPSPDLDDPVIFVRMSPNPEVNIEFWKRRFPDRAAWAFWPDRAPGADFVQIRTAWDFFPKPSGQ